MQRLLSAQFTLLALASAATNMDGFVAYFLAACPTGWSSFSLLEGRLALLVNNSYQAGATSGFPLADGEDRTHTHGVQGTLSLKNRDIAALGGFNNQAAKAGAQPLLPFFNVSFAAPSGLPFVQFTACRYSALSLQPPPALPAGFVTIFDQTAKTSGCPLGYAPLTSGGEGNLLVLGAAAGVIVGGASPLEPGDDLPTHAHAFSSSINLPAVDFAGIAGCCDHDVATSGTAPFNGVTAQSGDGVPYAAVLACNSTGAGAAVALPPSAILLSTQGCPSGWSPLGPGFAGRFVVGAQLHGLPSRSFGSDNVVNTSEWLPLHAHDFAVDVDLNPVGVELASGCCAHDYGGAGTFSAAGATGASPSAVPPFTVLQACQTESRS